jgi:hypothetical protein
VWFEQRDSSEKVKEQQHVFWITHN